METGAGAGPPRAFTDAPIALECADAARVEGGFIVDVFFFVVDCLFSGTPSRFSLVESSSTMFDRCVFLLALGLSLSRVLFAAALGLTPALGLTDALGLTGFFEDNLLSLAFVAPKPFGDGRGCTMVLRTSDSLVCVYAAIRCKLICSLSLWIRRKINR